MMISSLKIVTISLMGREKIVEQKVEDDVVIETRLRKVEMVLKMAS